MELVKRIAKIHFYTKCAGYIYHLKKFLSYSGKVELYIFDMQRSISFYTSFSLYRFMVSYSVGHIDRDPYYLKMLIVFQVTSNYESIEKNFDRIKKS